MNTTRILYCMKYMLWVLVLLSLIVQSACSGGGSSEENPKSDDPETQAVTVRFQAPSPILSASGINLDAVSPSVSINGHVVSGFQEDAGTWSRVKTELLSDSNNNFRVVWNELFSNKELKLGEVVTVVHIKKSDTVVTLDQSEFVTDFDADSDGITNFLEREAASDPYVSDANSTETSLSVTASIPNVEYAGSVDLVASWNGKAISMVRQGQVYTGKLSAIIPGSGSFYVHIKSAGTIVYEYRVNEYKVNRGENNQVVNAEDFTPKPIKTNVKANIPSRDYGGNIKVKVSGVSGNSFEDMGGSGTSYSKSFNNVSTGNKKVKIEIRSKAENWLWATAQKSYKVKVGTNNISFSSGDFNFNIDSDGDGLHNIDDPNPSVPEVVSVDVTIPYTTNGAPSIDGNYTDLAWNSAVTRDSDSKILHINHLMIEKRTNPGSDLDDAFENDLRPQHTWAAMYDDQYLYLLVKVIDDYHDTCDSDNAWDDDDLNIYWDGDNSKGSSYDGINDFHILIPMFERVTNDGECNASYNKNGRRRQGNNSAPLPTGGDLIFATGLSDESTGDEIRYVNTYEVRINLEKARIIPGRPFGIDIHIDDDDDGGIRDQKWGWYHRSRRGSSNVDDTYKKPSVMATAVLE